MGRTSELPLNEVRRREDDSISSSRLQSPADSSRQGECLEKTSIPCDGMHSGRGCDEEYYCWQASVHFRPTATTTIKTACDAMCPNTVHSGHFLVDLLLIKKIELKW